MDKIHYTTETQTSRIRSYHLTKRIIDIIGSIVLLIFLTPWLILFSLLILIFSGRPIYFRQVRTGKYNKPFTIWKFRTMENIYEPGKSHNYYWRDGVPKDFVFKGPTNQRVTRIGEVYRRLSIDELPQLINVLSGEMSLVGPRPEIPEITELYSRYQVGRLKMKPGITGYAQVNGRSINTHGQKIKYDCFYIDNCSLILDFKIILKTFGLVIRCKGAY